MHRECRERFPCYQLQRKPLISNPHMHHGTCITHVPWCMLGSLTALAGKTFLAFQRVHDPEFYVSGKRPMKYFCFNSRCNKTYIMTAIPLIYPIHTWILVWLIGTRKIWTKPPCIIRSEWSLLIQWFISECAFIHWGLVTFSQPFLLIPHWCLFWRTHLAKIQSWFG